MVLDCTTMTCLPVEIFAIFIGTSIFLGIAGLMRQPQIPALLAVGGILLFFVAIITSGVILGIKPDSSTTTGDTTTFDMVNNEYDMQGLPQVFGAIGGIVMMLYGGISVYSKNG